MEINFGSGAPMTHFVSTVAELSACTTCGLPTLRALDEGMPARVDLVPLSDLPAEITAIAGGRRTYTRLRNGQLAYRDDTRLSDPAMAAPVHAEHRCTRRRP
jgi:hypothetical protein